MIEVYLRAFVNYNSVAHVSTFGTFVAPRSLIVQMQPNPEIIHADLIF